MSVELAPLPAPMPLPDGYDRHQPAVGAQRSALGSLLDGPDWAALSWPDLVQALVRLGRTDISLARLAEGHIDALRILGQAGVRRGQAA